VIPEPDGGKRTDTAVVAATLIWFAGQYFVNPFHAAVAADLILTAG
jgi:hypothetical protein